MIPVADPFMADVRPTGLQKLPGDFARNSQGTPYVSNPTGRLVKPKRKADPPRIATEPYGRPSGFGDLIEDMYSVWKWSERQEALGFALVPDLAIEAAKLIVDDHDTQEWRRDADKIVVAAKAAAKAGIAAERGTHAHELTEDDDNERDIITRIEAGEELGLSHEVQRSLVDVWRQMLERDGLEILAIEATVVHDGYRQAGTLDRLARLTKPLKFRLITGEIIELPAGDIPVLDVKSGKRRLRNNGTVMYWQSYAVQVAVYAGAVPYDTETDTRGAWPFKIDQRWALIAHLDVLGAIDGNPSCELILVDIEAGRHAADLCLAAKKWAAEMAVFSVAQLDVPGERLTVVDPSPGTPDVEGVDGVKPLDPVIPAHAPSTLDVEGGVGACHSAAVDPARHDHASPSTPVSPQAATAVNAGGVGSSADQPPHPPVAGYAGVDWTVLTPKIEALAWASQPAPTPLAPLPENPDEGRGVGAGMFRDLEADYKTLDAANRAWISRLVSEAARANVGFHTQSHHTQRRYWIVQGLVSLASDDDALRSTRPDDDVLRALCVAALHNDAPMDPRHTAGACVGSLNAEQAQRFATLVDDYLGVTA